MTRRLKVLYLTTDPLTGRMPGPAIRAWSLAGQLAAEHEVVLASTVACSRTHPMMACRHVDPASDLAPLEEWMDVLVAPAGVLGFWPAVATSAKTVVFDLYDPYHLEHLEPSRPGLPPEDRDRELRVFADAIAGHLATGDFFMCASERQRDFWIGSLVAAGRVNAWTYEQDPTLRRLIDTVPFGLPPVPPAPVGTPIGRRVPGLGGGADVVLWAGGVYDWFDPVSVILAVDELRRRRPAVKLVFLGARHPNPAIPDMRAATESRELADRLGLTGAHVFFNEGWVPYEERSDFLLGARVGVSTHLDHLETRYSFRTRVLDYIWARLPMVLTAGDVLSEWAERDGVGRSVPAGEVPALVDALDEMLGAEVPPERFDRLVGELRWDRTARPLLAFVASAGPAADRAAGRGPGGSDGGGVTGGLERGGGGEEQPVSAGTKGEGATRGSLRAAAEAAAAAARSAAARRRRS